ncbi:SDR family NAD(P)-dependent oxidoreductase [Prauserella cavernicola]|uniref:SDR family NAD(P)-dependent oxidoreductase n=1 Tax=Prauserella cavernicola TaxID=2800127 RepID=UPI001E4521C2|nr:SDR family NAD(P)-dependent oxidoreductase [Prauserella cavernicola]
MLDTLLDRTVVLGYSRWGYRLRRRGWAQDDPPAGSLRGKVVLVTGASSGLGEAAAIDLAKLGAAVVLVVRNVERGERTLERVREAVPEADVSTARCDLSDPGSVREFAATRSRVDVLLHNAGVLPKERTENADGHELTLATHVLGPLLLTELLRPVLRESADARVILMSSGGMYTQALAVDDPEYRQGTFRGATAYARTKRMQAELTPLLSQRWSGDGIGAYCLHPGWADTPGVADSLPGFQRLTSKLLRTPAEGADTAVWLAATRPAPPSGRFWHDRRERPLHLLPRTRPAAGQRERLLRYCLEAIGL